MYSSCIIVLHDIVQSVLVWIKVLCVILEDITLLFAGRDYDKLPTQVLSIE